MTSLPAFQQWVNGANGRTLHVNRPLPQFDQNAWSAIVNVAIEPDGLIRRYSFGETIGWSLVSHNVMSGRLEARCTARRVSRRIRSP